MTFDLPQALLLAIPLGLLLARFGRAPAPASWLRWTAALALVLALAGPALDRGGDAVDVVVLVDRSRSMPPGSDAAAEELIGLLEGKRGPGQRVGIVTFGREARVERQPSPEGRFGGFQRPVDAEASDLAAGLQAAEELIPSSRSGRVVVLSDGLATGSDPSVAARRLALRGIPVDFKLLSRGDPGAGVAVLEVDAPPSVAQGETFLVSARVYSSGPASVGYVLTRNGVPIAKGRADLTGGERRLLFRDRLEQQGLADYRLLLEGARDAVPENDQGRAVARAVGPPRLLLLRSDGAPGVLARALKAAGVDVQVSKPGFGSLDALEGFQAVILEDVPAEELREPAMRALDLYVRELGRGLLMTGGPHSFGQGGYLKSPLDGLLPVSMELRKEQRRSTLALVIAMDRSGSMSVSTPDGRTKMSLAAEGAVAALTLLSDGDEAAVWVVDERAHEVLPLTQVEGDLDLDKVARVESEGGGIFIYEALEAAALQLEQSDKQVRHLILFADAADSEEPGQYQQLLADLAVKKITVSVIGMGTPSDVDAALLQDIAARGGGRIYFSDTATSLPRLFAQETITLARASFIDEATPLALGTDLAMLGLAQAELGAPPAVGGYNLTYLRPGASVAYRTADDNKAPALALWQRGMGRVAAVAMETDGPRAAQLASWPGYRALFGKLARWLMAGQDPEEALVKVRRRGHELEVSLETDPAQPLEGRASVSLLPGDGVGAIVERPLHPSGEGRLAARFPLTASGAFHPVVKVGGRVLKGPPVTLPYAPDFEPRDPSEGRAALEGLAKLTGGVERLSADGAFKPGADAPGRTLLAAWLVAAALLLMLAEVAARRLGFAMPKLALRLPTRERGPAGRPAPGPRPAPQSEKAAEPATPEPPPSAPAEAAPEPVASALDEALKRVRNRTGGPPRS